MRRPIVATRKNVESGPDHVLGYCGVTEFRPPTTIPSLKGVQGDVLFAAILIAIGQFPFAIFHLSFWMEDEK
jgi:hypothetical protein